MICRCRRCSRNFSWIETRQILPRETHFAGSHRHESQNCAGERGFSAARFAHDSERLASRQVETHAVHGAQNFPRAKPSVAGNFKVHAQIAHGKDRLAHAGNSAAVPSGPS